MHQLLHTIRENLTTAPENVAIWTQAGSFTNDELYRYALRVANAFRRDGLGKGDRVTIELPRCREYAGVYLGAMMLGVSFAALDCAYPADRLSYIAGDCGARIRVTADYLAAMPDACLAESDFADMADADELFLCYTSGSTGKPKGVIHTYASMRAALNRAVPLMDFRDQDNLATMAPFPFIAGIQPLIAMQYVGRPVFVIPDEARINLNKLADFTAAHQITHIFMPAAMIPFFKQKEKTIKTVVVGGETTSNVWSDDFTILNTFGMTETGMATTSFRLDKAYENTPIGTAIGGEVAYVLDAAGNETAVGEICIAGDVSAGYLNMPEKTRQAFRPNPFRDRDGHAILFHTGDLGRRGEDGNITFLERLDWLVKVNGQRVEPGEIANVMLTLPQIMQAVVRDWKSEDGQTFLAAYYRAVAPITPDEVRAFLTTKLPSYMIPAYITAMQQMPLNTNGKIDRSRLPRPDAQTEKKQEPQRADGDVASFVRQCLRRYTGRDFTPDEDLVRGGVSSMTAVKIAADVMDAFGTDLDVLSMLSGCSIRSIEQAIRSQLEEAGSDQAPADRPKRDAYPLTGAQLGVYGAYYRDPGNVSYNIPFTISFDRGDVTTAQLSAALETVVNAHDALKCTIDRTPDGEIAMYPHPDAAVRLTVQSGSQEAFEQLRDRFVAPFDLREGVYRLVLFETPDKLHLLADFHHILFDGSSAAILRRDLTTALAGARVRSETYTMLDLAADEENLKQSDAYRNARDYFQTLLGDVEKTTMLLRDRYEDGSRKGHLRTQLRVGRQDVAAFTSRFAATENHYFQAVMGFVMARYSGEDDACYATVYNGRKGGKTGRTIGMMVKTLPVVCRTEKADAPETLIAAVRDQLGATMANDLYPFAKISERFGVGAETIFVYQGLSDDAQADLRAEMELADVKNPLSVQLYPVGEHYLLDVTYDAAYYSDDLMQGFAESFDTAAAAFCTKTRLADVGLCGENQLSVLNAYNATAHDYERGATLADLFARHAAADPDHTAVVCGENSVTYGELDRLTDTLAAYIASRGIGRDDFVAVLADRSVQMVTAALGVVKARAAYEPLDVKYPLERLRFMTADSRARLLIADRSLAERSDDLRAFLTEFPGEILYTDEFTLLPQGLPVPAMPQPRDAVVILYTSGTTGKPKGCVIEHAQASAYFECFRTFMCLSPRSRVAMYASFGFDAGFQDVFTTLAAGATLYVLEESVRYDISAMEKYFNENAITNTFMTTQVGRMFAENADVPSLEYFVAGGEKLTPFVPPAHMHFFNGYGPSETLCCVTHHEVTDDAALQCVGKAHFNTKLYIADKHMNRLPVGALGELCIAGEQVSRGYLDRPEKTAEVFVANPFEDVPGYERVYRTGDVARIMPGGEIDLTGRNDGQVKVRGNRVELTEVESVIRAYPDVRNVTVQAYDDPAGGKYIAAFIVADAPVDPKALEAFILARKPSYMVPAVTVMLPEIPLTVNGKVDKRSLPAPRVQAQDLRAPENPLQEKIFGIVAESLGSDRFGIDTDLTEAGLTSLNGIRLSVRLANAFGVPVSANDLRRNSTVEKLETFLLRSGETAVFDVQDDYPLTQTQTGIFVECAARPDSTVYNVPTLLRLAQRPDIDRLREAAAAAVNAHDYLLTELFYNESGDVRKRRKGLAPFTAQDVRLIRTDDIEKTKKELVRPFDLTRDRLIRCAVIDAGDVWFFADVHHILCDGTSMSILLDDISRAYAGEALEAETFTGYEESLREQALRKTAIYEEARAFYRDLLADCDRQTLPALPAGESRQDGQLHRTGSPETAQAIRAYTKSRELSVNAFMCGAFGAVLAAASGVSRPVFTTVYNGRNDSRLARTVAMLTKTLPVVIDAQSESAPEAAIRGAGEQLMNAMANDVFSFAEISRAFGVRADVIFIYQGDGFRAERFCSVACDREPLTLSDRKAPLCFQAILTDDGPEYLVEYDAGMFTAAMIEALTERFDNALTAMTRAERFRDVTGADLPPLWQTAADAPNDETPAEDGAAPESDRTDDLCALFAQVLNLPSVSPDDDFFAIGGNSILATKLVFVCGKAGLPVDYQSIFDYPTPKKLARHAAAAQAKTDASAIPSDDAAHETPADALGAVLAGNVAANLDGIGTTPPGDVLLTGATGYLGMHLLRELLNTQTGRIICLVRPSGGFSAEKHLIALLHYYFGSLPESEAFRRVQIAEGDISDPALTEELDAYSFDTIINCAANVRHFDAIESLERANHQGVVNLIDVAARKNARLIQISTVSVAGESVDGSIPAEKRLRECEMDIGQTLSNGYIRTKFEAERAVLQAVADGRIRGKVIRLGNLASRASDGDFQINASNNGFMRRLRAYIRLGCYPVEHLDAPVEFSPIDAVARAVVLLCGTPDAFTVFHANNCHAIHMANVIEALNETAHPVEIVSEAEFTRRFLSAASDEAGAADLTGLVAYQQSDGERHALIGDDNSFTVKALYRLGFSWPLTGIEYVRRAIEMLDSMLYFEE